MVSLLKLVGFMGHYSYTELISFLEFFVGVLYFLTLIYFSFFLEDSIQAAIRNTMPDHHHGGIVQFSFNYHQIALLHCHLTSR